MRTISTHFNAQRLISIDALRALTMVLMIFVNDLWSLSAIPSWLEHMPANVDGLGLADIVFPAFLFIVGLSVPYAIESRKKKGETNSSIWRHIISRTIILLIMGVFIVNAEVYADNAVLQKGVWMILLIIAFFLIGLHYKNPKESKARIGKSLGIVLLVVLAILFKSADGATGIMAMKVYWWGILGLIGWGYFIASGVFLLSKGNVFIMSAVLVFFIAFNAADNLGWLSGLVNIRNYVWIVENGAVPAFSMTGVLCSIAYRNLTIHKKEFWIYMSLFSAAMVIFGLVTRPIWGISKIGATPSWATICTGITLASFLIVILVADVYKKTGWYTFIKPAGSYTLTCYLLPYIHYAVLGMVNIRIPIFLRTGFVGIGKSLLYALLIVAITGLLGRKNISLKI